MGTVRKKAAKYVSYIENHPRLMVRIRMGLSLYHPILQIGNRLTSQLSDILKAIGDGRSQNLTDYLPFYRGLNAKVSQDTNGNLVDLIYLKISKDGRASDCYIQKERKNHIKQLQIFWYCYARAINPEANQMTKWASVNMLDMISVFLGYANFNEFLKDEYPPVSNRVNIIFLPFDTSEQNAFVGRMVFDLLRKLEREHGGDIKILTYQSKDYQDERSGIDRYIKSNDLNPSETLVLIGTSGQSGKYRLECRVLNEVWARPNGAWSGFFDLRDLEGPDFEAYKKIRLSIYWCLFNLRFFYQDYEASDRYLRYAFDLQLDRYEVPFRVVALHVIRGNLKKAKVDFLGLLAFLGVENAKEQLGELFTSHLEDSTSDVGTYLEILGERIRLDDLQVDFSEFHPDKKTIFFDIFRMRCFYHLKSKLSPENFLRILKKIVKNPRTHWLTDPYKGLFGEANFEMGKWLISKCRPDELLSPATIADYYVKAVTYSSLDAIHKECIPFLKNYGRFEEVRSKVLQVHAQHPSVLALYGPDDGDREKSN